MKYPSLPSACDHRGASMGRDNVIEERDQPIKFRLYRMPMSSCGAYDSGGAYWGCGSFRTGWMWHAFGDGAKFVNEMFVRAIDRDAAKAQVRAIFPQATFFK